MPPACEPVGPHAKLVFVPGLLGGHMLTGCDPLSIGRKSPLTHGIEEAIAGGTSAFKRVGLGMKDLILEGVLPVEESRWWFIHVSASGARIEPAGASLGWAWMRAPGGWPACTAPDILEKLGKETLSLER